MALLFFQDSVFSPLVLNGGSHPEAQQKPAAVGPLKLPKLRVALPVEPATARGPAQPPNMGRGRVAQAVLAPRELGESQRVPLTARPPAAFPDGPQGGTADRWRAPPRHVAEPAGATAHSDPGAATHRAAAVLARHGHESLAAWSARGAEGHAHAAVKHVGHTESTASQAAAEPAKAGAEATPLALMAANLLDALPLLLREDERLVELAAAHRAQLAACRRKRWEETAARGRQRARHHSAERGRSARQPPARQGSRSPGSPISMLLRGRPTPAMLAPTGPSAPSSLLPTPFSAGSLSAEQGPLASPAVGSGATVKGIPSPQVQQSLDSLKNGLMRSLPHRQSVALRLRKLKKLRKKRGSWLEDQAMRGPYGTGLGPEQRAKVHEVFNHYDLDSSGTLDAAELREALADLGFCPRSQHEKRQFAEILHRADESGDGELDIDEFTNLVADVMQALREALRMEVEEQFHLHDTECKGSLALPEVLSILEEMALGPRTDAERRLVEEIMMIADADGSGELAFAEFEDFLVQVREALGRQRRERLREVISICGLPRAAVQAMSHELCELKDKFDSIGPDSRGLISHKAVHILVADCGIRPAAREDREKMCHLIAQLDADGHQHVSFPQFLRLVRQLREMALDGRRNNLREMFKQADDDGSGALSLAECSKVLGLIGMSPRTRAQQRRIAGLLELADEDGSGQLDFPEFCVLCQHVHELLQTMLRKQECETARNLNLSMEKVEEYRLAFDMFDEEDTGELRVEDVRRLVDALHVHINGDLLNELVGEVDADGSGVIEFDEFLTLMSLIEARRAATRGVRVVVPVETDA